MIYFEELLKECRLEDQIEVGKKLRKLRTNARLSVEELANKIQVSVPTVFAYENGYRRPSDEIKVAYSKLFADDLKMEYGDALCYLFYSPKN